MLAEKSLHKTAPSLVAKQSFHRAAKSLVASKSLHRAATSVVATKSWRESPTGLLAKRSWRETPTGLLAKRSWRRADPSLLAKKTRYEAAPSLQAKKSWYETATSLQQVLAIMCYGRSGATFFQSLLDGHPNLIVVAGLYLMPFYNFFNDHSHLPAQQLVSEFVKWYEPIFDARTGWIWEDRKGEQAEFFGFNSMGPNQDESLELNRDVFLSCLMSILNEHAIREKATSVPRKLFFQAIYVAYQHALGRSVDNDTIIVHTLHNPFPRSEAAQFAEDFPHAKYIYVVRQPIESLASHFRSIAKVAVLKPDTGSDHINGVLIGGESHRLPGAGAVSSFLNSVALKSPTVNRWKEYSRAIRLEDLHRDSRRSLEKICNWLEIPWNDVLMTSSFHGLKWWNFSISPKVSGFSEAPITVKAKDDVLTELDTFRLKVLLFRKFAVWNYDISSWYSSIFAKVIVLPLLLVPFKMEIISIATAFKGDTTSMGSKLLDIVRASLGARRRLLTAWLVNSSHGRPEAELV